MKFNNIFLSLSLFALTACSSVNEPAMPDNPAEDTDMEKVSLTFNVGLDSEIQSRASERDATSNELGKGNRITTLIYAVFDKDGVATQINPDLDKGDGNLTTQIRINDYFSHDVFPTLELELVKGLEYTVVFWAMSDYGDLYFNTEDLTRIVFNRGQNFMNNTDTRDVFCYSYKIIQFEAEQDRTFILYRPFAQINIGVSQDIWESMTDHDKVEKSSITINGISSHYNLYTNTAEGEDTHIETLGVATLQPNTIPFNVMLEGDSGQENQYLTIVDRNNPNDVKKYVWLSMSFVLPADYDYGETGSTAYIELLEMNLWDADNNKITLQRPDGSDVILSGTLAVPALRNHRTNVIIDGIMDGSIDVSTIALD